MRSILLKELSIFFASSRFYMITGVFLFLFGIYFFNAAAYVSLLAVESVRESSKIMSMNDFLLRPLFFDLCSLVFYMAPFLSMGLYSSEKDQGTLELLLTYPLSNISVLMGKYLAAVFFFMIMLLLSLGMMVVLAFMTSPDWGVVSASYLGILLLGCTILSIGIFSSALSGSHAVAVSLTFAISLVFWTCGWCESLLAGMRAGIVFRELSFVNHVSPFFQGIISLKDISFFLGLSLFFLVLAFTVMDSGRR